MGRYCLLPGQWTQASLILYMMGFTVPNTHLVFYAREIRGYSDAAMLMPLEDQTNEIFGTIFLLESQYAFWTINPSKGHLVLQVHKSFRSIMGIASTVGRLSGGLLSAVFRPSLVFIVMVTTQGTSLISLAFCQEGAELVAFAILFGFSSGARTGLLSLVIAEIFEIKRLAPGAGLNTDLTLQEALIPLTPYDAHQNYCSQSPQIKPRHIFTG